MKKPDDCAAPEISENQKRMDEVIARAVRRALIKHKRARNPIAVYQDGKVVWIPPDEIMVDETEFDQTS